MKPLRVISTATDLCYTPVEILTHRLGLQFDNALTLSLALSSLSMMYKSLRFKSFEEEGQILLGLVKLPIRESPNR